MNCDTFRENISYYIDDILDDNEKCEFEHHMNNCDKCKCEYEQMVILIDSLNSIEQVPLPDNYDKTLRKKLNNEKVKDKRKWSKYMYIAASLAIVFFSVHNIENLKILDIQENANIEIIENTNNKDVQQSPSVISNSENTEDEIENVKRSNIVSTVSNDKKTNIMSIQMASDEPLQKKNRSIAYFSMSNEYQKNIKVGDDFEITLENPKDTKYSMVCDDEDGLIDLISQSNSENEEVYSYIWKFKGVKAGKVKISYILHDKIDENKVYNEIVYEINIQE